VGSEVATQQPRGLCKCLFDRVLPAVNRHRNFPNAFRLNREKFLLDLFPAQEELDAANSEFELFSHNTTFTTYYTTTTYYMQLRFVVLIVVCGPILLSAQPPAMIKSGIRLNSDGLGVSDGYI
jgi:hypothetical protein